MASHCFADRIGERIALAQGERMALAPQEDRERALRRGAGAGERSTADMFVLRSGLMMSFVILDDGSRQILRFIFPRDLIGLSALACARAREAVAALADSVVCPFERGVLARLATDQPRLFAAIVAIDQIERVALTDRLAGLGQGAGRIGAARPAIICGGSIRRWATASLPD